MPGSGGHRTGRLDVVVRRIRLWSALVLVAIGCRPQDEAQETARPDPHPIVVLETTKGMIALELDRERAPTTVANFLAHVRVGFYDSLIVHRVEAGFVIQTGYYRSDGRRVTSSATPIMNESENGLSNLRGTVAMARQDYPHSATSQFFINLVDNQKLDPDQFHDGWGYAVFGRVVEGMEVVDAIAAVETTRRNRENYWPVDPIVIGSAHIQETEPGSR
jgi:cyclophilin family peptidyl-prolyl cis-trans isomerase